MTAVLELFGRSTSVATDWPALVREQRCPFLQRKCIKVRKSEPEVSIGTCSVSHGRRRRPMIICPYRLLEPQPARVCRALGHSAQRLVQVFHDVVDVFDADG